MAAFEKIVRRFERPVRAWVATHCPPGGDSDEVAQRTFIAAFTRLGEFEEGTNFPAWLFTIARYQLMTEATRLRRLADYQSRYAPDLLDRELERRASEAPWAMTARLAHLVTCLEALGEWGSAPGDPWPRSRSSSGCCGKNCRSASNENSWRKTEARHETRGTFLRALDGFSRRRAR